MPYPYNHIYTEAKVPPLPVGRPPSGPPPTMDGVGKYSSQVVKAANSPASPQSIAVFANGVYSVMEDSTIYGTTPRPGKCKGTEVYMVAIQRRIWFLQ